MNFDLSVIIPTFKRKGSLIILLQKLFAQEAVRIEIIVVDQNPVGFFDEEQLGTLAKVKYIYQSQPNASLARNAGFLLSSALFVLFLDDDLIPENDFCKKGLAILKEYNRVKCFSPNVFNHNGPQQSKKNILSSAIKGNCILNNIFLITDTMSAAIFWERNYFIKSGGFDPMLFQFAKTGEDQELFLRMKKRNMQLWFVSDIEIYHDEYVAGGCELRTEDYWVTRKKCIFSWALRYRIHNEQQGKLRVKDIFALSRSAFANRLVLTSGINEIKQNFYLILDAIGESKNFYCKHANSYKLAKQNFFYMDVID